MVKKYIITRDVTKNECPWLDETLKKDTVVFEYTDCTYGCVTGYGIAMTMEEDKTPFFEVPLSAVSVYGEKIKRFTPCGIVVYQKIIKQVLSIKGALCRSELKKIVREELEAQDKEFDVMMFCTAEDNLTFMEIIVKEKDPMLIDEEKLALITKN